MKTYSMTRWAAVVVLWAGVAAAQWTNSPAPSPSTNAPIPPPNAYVTHLSNTNDPHRSSFWITNTALGAYATTTRVQALETALGNGSNVWNGVTNAATYAALSATDAATRAASYPVGNPSGFVGAVHSQPLSTITNAGTAAAADLGNGSGEVLRWTFNEDPLLAHIVGQDALDGLYLPDASSVRTWLELGSLATLSYAPIAATATNAHSVALSGVSGAGTAAAASSNQFIASLNGAGTNTTLAGVLNIPSISTSNRTLTVGSLGIQPYAINNVFLAENCHYSNGWKYVSNGAAVLFGFYGREGYFRCFTNGVAGAALPLSGNATQFKVSSDGTVAMGGIISDIIGNYTGAAFLASNGVAQATGHLNVTSNLTVNGAARIVIPTATNGLTGGMLWNDGGTLKVTP